MAGPPLGPSVKAPTVGRWQEKLARGELVVIDGGTGTELERRGVPMSRDAWSGLAVRTHPDIVREVHEAYICAGAEVIATNTFGTVRFVLEAAGIGDEFEQINRRAVELAVEARDRTGRDVAVAGSLSNLPPGMLAANYPPPEVEMAALRELAKLLADSGVDIIALEMMQDGSHAARAMEAALETGLPVWLGVSCRRRAGSGGLVSFDLPNVDFATPLDTLIPMGPSVVNVMHSEIEAVPEAIAMVRERWAGPVGVYPEIGEFEPPHWRVEEEVSPDRFVACARDWVARGALLVGGCCGTTPQHIEALSRAFRSLPAPD